MAILWFNKTSISELSPLPIAVGAANKRLFAEQVRLLYAQAPVGFLANLFCALALGYAQWNYISHDLIIRWFVCLMLTLFLRLQLTQYFVRSTFKAAQADYWAKWYILASALTGLVWGLAGVLLYPVASIAHQVIIAFFLAGMTAGAAAVLSAVFPATVLYILAALVPFIIRLTVTGGSLQLTMAAVSILFAVFLLTSAKRIHYFIITALNLQYENKDLIEKLKAEEGRLLHQATHDVLTNLPNRSLLMDRLDQAILQAKRTHELVGVMFCDLDKFKQINDNFGHSVGDLALQAFAERLKHSVRESDTIARLGGDEFIVVLPLLEKEENIALIAQKFLQALAQPMMLGDQELSIKTSIGISVYPKDGLDASTLLRKADSALYTAKKAGRNNWQYYSPNVEHINKAVDLDLQ